MSTSDDTSTPPDAIVEFINSTGFTIDHFMSPDEGGAMIDVFGCCYHDYRIEQYAQDVFCFSSQYGSDYSISYTANNVVGRPAKWPEYGDFAETFAMRTYGNWWEKAPSRFKEIQPQNQPKVPAHDFLVLQFENYIIPDDITIFETFNPGAIVRIWAFTIVRTWCCLWECEHFFTKAPNALNSKARKFSPNLRKLNLPAKHILLEFNHSRLNYFTEIDAVLFGGRYMNKDYLENIMEYYREQNELGPILSKLKTMQIRPNFSGNYKSTLKEFLVKDLEKYMPLKAVRGNKEEAEDFASSNESSALGLNDMPFDILLHIFSFLDLKSLYRVGKVSRLFYEVSAHPLLYCELNLQPYWNIASIDLLCSLAKRATSLKKLDLSWCGLFDAITGTEFKKFIQQRGDNLTHLRLNSCKFLNSTCIDTLGIVCDNLKELSLRNCVPLINCTCLTNLKNLERLDLFQTEIESDLLLPILESNRKLKHLNLAFCGISVNMDHVAQHISKHNLQLVSLDMWKSHFLSAIGLQALSNCHDLEEVDFGWCLREAPLGQSLIRLVTNCRKLRKLFLGAVRGITDNDIGIIANLCTNLEQLDLMGVIGISKDRYLDILKKCHKLQLLDLSFCDNVDEEEITTWSELYGVSIKRSFSSNEHEV